MNTRKQLTLIILILLFLGGAGIAYKRMVLGFPAFSGDTQTLWKIEGKIEFVANGDPVTVSLNLPDPSINRRVVFSDLQTPGWDFQTVEEEGVRYGRWEALEANGEQIIYFRADLFFEGPEKTEGTPVLATNSPDTHDQIVKAAEDSGFTGKEQDAALQFTEQLREKNFDLDRRIRFVLSEVNANRNEHIKTLLHSTKSRKEILQVAVKLLAMQNVPARAVQAVLLTDSTRKQRAHPGIEVVVDGYWQYYDARDVSKVSYGEVLVFQHADESLLEVFGGSQSTITFSTLRTRVPAFRAALDAAKYERNEFINLSLYTLPVSEQNAFKLLLLIPLGALVVVILRNIAGIRTSGTFMPILIALTFMQTNLVTGLILFLIVVSVGLVMRSYLSHLNLLLVPRIASILVFVILIYAAVGIISHKMDWTWGLKVTFFPMIILSWTIERMSILWDEDGAKEVFIQVGGSLLTATLAYLLMSNEFIADTIFVYPEMLLIILAVIISIGSYSGYRLSDLYRFKPMEKL